uniref:MYB-CC type transcription factor LHEQLE-containing domain-containing protein n=1 Tax=Oryza punctata TaxID=4537 RepID=A0A0E0LU25_ORYPU
MGFYQARLNLLLVPVSQRRTTNRKVFYYLSIDGELTGDGTGNDGEPAVATRPSASACHRISQSAKKPPQKNDLESSSSSRREGQEEEMFPGLIHHHRLLDADGGGGGGGSSAGLVLTADPKPRLRWTADLHDRFVDAVAQLGGPDSKFSSEQFGDFIPKKAPVVLYVVRSNTENYHEDNGCEGAHPFSLEKPPSEIQIRKAIWQRDGRAIKRRSQELKEALRAQMEVQRKLHEQVEVQRHVQIRMEAYQNYINTLLEKACNIVSEQLNGFSISDHDLASAGVMLSSSDTLSTSIFHQLSVSSISLHSPGGKSSPFAADADLFFQKAPEKRKSC